MQASRRPSPGLVSAQNCFTSAAQALTFTALSTTAWQPSDRSLRCVLRQALILPPPGSPLRKATWHHSGKRPLTLPHAMEHGSNNMAARKRELVNAIRVLISEPPVWGSRRSGRTLRDALDHRGRDAREHGLGLRGLQYFGNRVRPWRLPLRLATAEDIPKLTGLLM